LTPAHEPLAVSVPRRVSILLLAAWILVVFGAAVPVHRMLHHHEEGGGHGGPGLASHDHGHGHGHGQGHGHGHGHHHRGGRAVPAPCGTEAPHLHELPPAHDHSVHEHSFDLPFLTSKKSSAAEHGALAAPEQPFAVEAPAELGLRRRARQLGGGAGQIRWSTGPRAPPLA